MKHYYVSACLALLMLLFTAETGKAQRLCPLYGGLGLLYITDSTRVTITVKDLNPEPQLPETMYRIVRINKLIVGRVSGMYDEPGSKMDTSKYQMATFGTFPENIRFRNNNMELTSGEGDSLIKDNQGRVIKCFKTLSFDDGAVVYYRYINDTTILERTINKTKEDNSFISIYELDKDCYLKTIKEGHSSKDISTVQPADIPVESYVQFVYQADKSISQLRSFEWKDKKMVLTNTQTFTYKGGRPVLSLVFDEVEKRNTLQQIYTYGLK